MLCYVLYFLSAINSEFKDPTQNLLIHIKAFRHRHETSPCSNKYKYKKEVTVAKAADASGREKKFMLAEKKAEKKVLRKEVSNINVLIFSRHCSEK